MYINSNITNNQNQPIYRFDGKPIGHVIADTFYKNAIARKHMLRKPLAWASDIDCLEQAERYGARYFVIKDSETKTRYTATIQAFWDFGVRFNRNHGNQIALTLKHWRVDHPGQPTQQPSLPIKPDTPKQSHPQMALPI